jgi:hypothetical protein
VSLSVKVLIFIWGVDNIHTSEAIETDDATQTRAVTMNATALWGWQIKYAGDDRPSIRVSGDFAKAEAIAKKFNKYGESFEITPAPKQDRTIEMEQAAEEARKYV